MNPRSPAATPTPTRRRRARRGEGARLHDEILDAFDARLAETGSVDAISIRSLADALGVSPPALYLHFPDRDALVFAACNRHFADFDATLEAVDDPGLSGVERLRRMGAAYCAWGVAHPEAYRIMFMEREVEPPADLPIEELYGVTAMARLLGVVRDGVEAGEFASTDVTAIALAMWGAVHGATALLIVKARGAMSEHMPDYDDDAFIAFTLDTCLRGLRS